MRCCSSPTILRWAIAWRATAPGRGGSAAWARAMAIGLRRSSCRSEFPQAAAAFGPDPLLVLAGIGVGCVCSSVIPYVSDHASRCRG
jgi:hypothetical protein